MRQDYTDITVILDRTGSMAGIAPDMIGGFNSFITEQKKLPGICRVSLLQFDTEAIEWVYQAKDLKDVPDLVLVPRGGTPLWDAVGRGVTESGERLAKLDEASRPGHVLVMVITDGEENSSHEWNADQVKALITEQKDKYKWSFTFLGAGLDKFVVQQMVVAMAIPTLSSSPVTKSKKAVANAFSALSSNVGHYREQSAGETLRSYSKEQRDSMQEEDK